MSEYNENLALEAIKKMHIRTMKKALNLRKKYKTLDTKEIIQNEFFINNNVNQYTKHLINF